MPKRNSKGRFVSTGRKTTRKRGTSSRKRRGGAKKRKSSLRRWIGF